jgi:hypothetical protein
MWPFSKRRAAVVAKAAPAAPIASHTLQPNCSVCRSALTRLTPPPGSMLRPVYLGVVCRTCGWIECKSCKGSPSDAPCPLCASAVMPAYCALFDEAG